MKSPAIGAAGGPHSHTTPSPDSSSPSVTTGHRSAAVDPGVARRSGWWQALASVSQRLFARVWLTGQTCGVWLGRVPGDFVDAAVVGATLAVILLQTTLMWGSRPELLVVGGGVAVVCCVVGRLSRHWSPALGLAALASWLMLLPYAFVVGSRVLGQYSFTNLEQSAVELWFTIGLGNVCWLPAGLAATAVFSGHISRAAGSGASAASGPAALHAATGAVARAVFGAACGQALVAFACGPWWGLETTAYVLAAAALLRAVWSFAGASDLVASVAPATEVAPNGTSGSQAKAQEPSDSRLAGLSVGLQYCLAALLGAGAMLAVRWCGEWNQQSIDWLSAVVLGLGAGYAAGLWSGRRRSVTLGDVAFGTAVTGSLALVLQWYMVPVTLWLSIHTIQVWVMLAVRTVILGAWLAPWGFWLGRLSLDCITRSCGVDDDVNRALASEANPRWLRTWESVAPAGLVLSVLIGAVLGLRQTLAWGSQPVMASVFVGALCVGGLAVLLNRIQLGWSAPRASSAATGWRGWPQSRSEWAVVASCLALLVTSGLPFQSHWDQPSRAARLLFSTQTFVRAQEGWPWELLSHADDARLLNVYEGNAGPLTVWQERVGELHLRDCGIPLGGIATRPAFLPQPATEVLQAVYPLLFTDQPERVLLIGAGTSLSLSACLSFPIREVTCIEPDNALLAALRGPVVAQQGFNPWEDDRVRVLTTPIELAVRSAERDFDVILAHPRTSVTLAEASQFTTEYFAAVSQQLSESGVFCQRFSNVDYGVRPLQSVLGAMQRAFPSVAAIEVWPGELLLLGARHETTLMRPDLVERLEATHVRRILARVGCDWSHLLNLPAYQPVALRDLVQDGYRQPNRVFNGSLAFVAPRELLRRADKHAELKAALVKPIKSTRTSLAGANRPHDLLAGTSGKNTSRQSKVLDWLGPDSSTPELQRRLSELKSQMQLILNYPDAHWFEYRKVLREELQRRPRAAIRLVQATSGESDPEDEHRKRYFVALGQAAQETPPTQRTLDELTQLTDPYDPLLSYFAHGELAHLYARTPNGNAAQLSHLLHTIFYAPQYDISTKNVIDALELVTRDAEATSSDTEQFDVLNALLQMLRRRWESRIHVPVGVTENVVDDVNNQLAAIDAALDVMGELAPAADLTPAEWQLRRTAIERLLRRPLHAYRDNLRQNLRRTENLFEPAAKQEAAGQ